jgi:hypothetical protein
MFLQNHGDGIEPHHHQVKTHYIGTKWGVESPFLNFRFSVFVNKNI